MKFANLILAAAMLLGEQPIHANDVDALTPEIWSKFGLAILESNMVAGNLVHRDFEKEFARFGDIVNTRRPQAFEMKRKTKADDVTVQDANLDNIPVRLDQHVHVSFLLRDGEEALAMGDLVTTFLVPAMTAMAEGIDSIVLGQYGRFFSTAGVAGELLGMTSSNAKDFIVDTGKLLDDTKAPQSGRALIVSPAIKAAILKNATFSEADKRGDNGTALREASLGRILGFDMYSCQNMASITAGNTNTTGEIANSAGYPKGYTGEMVVDGFATTLTVGSWVDLEGQPYQIAAQSATLGATTGITLTTALREAVANNDDFIAYTPGAVNNVAGYAAGWVKPIVVNTFTVSPRKGQVVSFGVTNDTIYTIIGTPSTTEILLDRPLEAAIAHAAAVNLGPAGDYGFAFLRNAVSLVCRPMALPRTGALAGFMSHNGFALRTVITYDGNKQGHLVTLDALLGIAILDQNLGAVLAA